MCFLGLLFVAGLWGANLLIPFCKSTASAAAHCGAHTPSRRKRTWLHLHTRPRHGRAAESNTVLCRVMWCTAVGGGRWAVGGVCVCVSGLMIALMFFCGIGAINTFGLALYDFGYTTVGIGTPHAMPYTHHIVCVHHIVPYVYR